MGVESFLVTSSVHAILAQRLVRQLCTACREAYEPSVESLASIGITPAMAAGKVIHRAKGCPECLQTGHRGRRGIFELLLPSEEIKSIILRSSDAGAIKQKAMEQGMISLREHGARKVLDGLVTIAEVFRVTEQ
jgi:general secretion pathway protein E